MDPVYSAYRAYGGGLGKAISLSQSNSELLFEHRHIFRGYCRSTGNAESQRTDVIIVCSLKQQHSQKDPRDGRYICDLFFYGLEDVFKIELINHDNAGTHLQYHQHVGGSTEGMKERDEAKSSVILGSVAEIFEQRSLCGQIAVSENGAERFSRQT